MNTVIAGRLTMRALVERNHGDRRHLGAARRARLPVDRRSAAVLRLFEQQRSELEDGQKIAELELLRAMFALGADVQADDEIASVTDRGAPRSSRPAEGHGPGPAQAHAPRGALRRIG
jgi:hypothetical protein